VLRSVLRSDARTVNRRSFSFERSKEHFNRSPAVFVLEAFALEVFFDLGVPASELMRGSLLLRSGGCPFKRGIGF
jgi:hypothetical protein